MHAEQLGVRRDLWRSQDCHAGAGDVGVRAVRCVGIGVRNHVAEENGGRSSGV